LNELIHLKDLTIGSLRADDVNDLATLLGYLRILRIDYTDAKTLILVSKLCANLEKLKIGNYINCYRSLFPYFPNLIKLTCFQAQYDCDFELDSRYNDQLQVLDIPNLVLKEISIARLTKLRALKQIACYPLRLNTIRLLIKMPLERIYLTELTQINVFRLVEECSSLKILGCNRCDIDNEFLPKLLDILKAKGFRPDRPFQLYFGTKHQHNRKLMSQVNNIKSNIYTR